MNRELSHNGTFLGRAQTLSFLGVKYTEDKKSLYSQEYRYQVKKPQTRNSLKRDT